MSEQLAYQPLNYYNREDYLRFLEETDKAALASHLKTLFCPTPQYYDCTFNLQANLEGQSGVVWDVGCGPSGAHLPGLKERFPQSEFYGINPYISQDTSNTTAESQMLCRGIVEELDTDVLQRTQSQGIRQPTTILLCNVLRHVGKTGTDGLSRSFTATCNVLPVGGTVLIAEDLKGPARSEYPIYQAYQQLVEQQNIPFECTIQPSRVPTKSYLQLKKVT